MDISKRVTGPERAAIFMLALPEEVATTVFQRLDTSDIHHLSLAMVALGRVQAEVVEQVLRDFIDHLATTGSLIGTLEGTERLLSKILPKEQVEIIIEEIRGPAGRTLWDKLGNVSNDVLANYLKNEYPQTIAVVLSRIKPENAAGVMAALPETLAVNVISRMLQMEVVKKEIVDDIEKTLRVEFMGNLARTSKRDSFGLMAEIFNSLDRASESRLMGKLEEVNATNAEKIKMLMFTFDDLVKLDRQSIQILMRSIDKNVLSIALKGVSPQIQNVFFNCMTERAAKLIRDEIKQMGMVRIRDVENAQNKIVREAKTLSISGQIILDSKAERGDAYVG
ncbi:MAG: flagellar motor switch protein FliG [Proteobacteria bacterium]|nr:flagellar motor switch protein FliG [Pseudomonadota bacterium]